MTSEQNLCEICGQPMPEGEEMFMYHGYSGDCPKPPLPSPPKEVDEKKCTHAHCKCMDLNCGNFHYATCNSEFIAQERAKESNGHKLNCRDNPNAIYRGYNICTCTPHQPTQIKIVPSPRIDWCGDCKMEHGFDCPTEWEKEEREAWKRHASLHSSMIGQLPDYELTKIATYWINRMESIRTATLEEAKEATLKLIVSEINIAHSEGTPTARLTSLYNKVAQQTLEEMKKRV